jgi:hypothetical protein
LGDYLLDSPVDGEQDNGSGDGESHSTWIEEFCECSHPLSSPPEDKVFVTLIAYLDDSGTHLESHNAVMAGYWGGVKAWSALEYRWKEVLRSEGLQDHGFHAKEFWPRIDGERFGPYKGWSDERHHAFIDRLLTVIEECKVVPFAVGVNRSDWNNQPQSYRDTFGHYCKHEAKSPAVLAFQVCVSRVATYCKPRKRVHFICSHDKQGFPAMWEAYNYLRDSAAEAGDPIADVMGPITPENPKLVVQLQAADLLAYEAHLYSKRANGDPKLPVREEYMRAISNFRSMEDFWLFDAPRFEVLKAYLESVWREK